MIVISDTSPITYLLQINQVNLLPLLFKSVVIPARVYEELCEIEEQKKWLESGNVYWVEVKQVSDKELVKRFSRILDAGESEAIALAKELKADVLLIDEWEGRRIAIEEGLKVTGVIGILLEAKRQKIIDKIKPSLDILVDKGFRISESVYTAVIVQSGE